MTAPRDPDRLIDAYLDEGLDELPDPVYDAVRDRIEQTRQGAGIGRGRISLMSSNMKWGIAAAGVVVTAIVGFQLLGDSNLGGPDPTATPEPSTTSGPSLPADGSLPMGQFEMLRVGPPPVSVTIAATGWFGEEGTGILVKDDNPNPPDGAGLILFTGDLFVYGDPCQWTGTEPDSPATTVAELMTALASQAPRDATQPVDITVDGYAGKAITLHVPDDAAYSGGQFTDCDNGIFGSWTVSLDGDPYPSPERYSQGPGQIDEIWAVDVDGVLVVIDWGYYAGTPEDALAEMQAIVDSATFD